MRNPPDAGARRRQAEIVAHAAFRRRLYDFDVLNDAQTVAASLAQPTH